ncbi:MAG: Gfo/Idh/MocA family oxidoreductase [Caldilineaceae bacterium]|nr:Gfo/Idh/MocA family oxidoreductase [Caldilineaceae bacterium]
MMNEVRIAIVGMGIGRANAGGYMRHPRARVTALCDIVEERMVEAEQALGLTDVKHYTSYQEMSRDPEIDAVFVGVPNQFHVPVALEAVRSGKHVIVTKPLSDSAAAARELVEAAEAAGVVNMMSLSTRYSPEVQYLGNMSYRGDFGEIYYAKASSIRRIGIPGWSLGFIQKGGGAFRDMGVHVLDSVWWLMGMPKPVSVTGVSGAKFGPRGQGFWHIYPPAKPLEELAKLYDSDDYGGGFIRFENGSGLQVESFWASHQPEGLQMELFGTEAGAKYRPLTVYKTVDGAQQDVSIDLRDTGNRPLDRQIAWDNVANHFVECILDGVPCGAPLRHGLIVQEMMEALLESAQTGAEVRID